MSLSGHRAHPALWAPPSTKSRVLILLLANCFCAWCRRYSSHRLRIRADHLYATLCTSGRVQPRASVRPSERQMRPLAYR
jgi:hypothetical protein